MPAPVTIPTNAIYAIYVNGAEAPNCRFQGSWIGTNQFATAFPIPGTQFYTSMVHGLATLSLVAGDVITIRNMSNGTSFISGGNAGPGEPPSPGLRIGASMNILKVE